MQIKLEVEILVCEDRQARKTGTNKYMWRKRIVILKAIDL